MNIGIPMEIKPGENRVAIAPPGVRALVRARHRVFIERNAGVGSGIEDGEFTVAGAAILDSADEVWNESTLIMKVKEPLAPELARIRNDHILFTYLHLAADARLTRQLIASGVTAIGYETIETDDGRLPLLVPMSEIAGRMAAQVGARLLEMGFGGKGILLGGVPGVAPADVVIVGCGVVGFNAAKIAVGMGAEVTILDIDHDRMRYVDDVLHGNVITLHSNPVTVERAVTFADLVIGAVLIPGAKAPVLVSDEMVGMMKPGSVIIDVAVDQGGCVETIHPTTHAEPTYRVHEVLHYGVTNMPGAVPRTSTYALTNATLGYAQLIADLGLNTALEHSTPLRRGLNLLNGRVAHPGVAAILSE